MAKPNLFLLAPPVMFVAIAGLFFIGLGDGGDNLSDMRREGQAAPALFLEDLAGPAFTAADLQTPGVKFVNFWASWCGPCRAEHPNLEQLRDEGFAVYGINYRDQPADALGFLEELGNPYTKIGADPTARTALEWGTTGVPETFVIDGDGNIILRFGGPITERSLESTIRPAIESALRGERPPG